MPRKSASSNTVAEIKNTGLRPNWDYFWKVDAAWRSESDIGAQLITSSSSSQVRPPLYRCSSASESEGSIQQVRFVTGSLWIGVWDKPGMNGTGVYQLPNGVVYNGHMSGGLCDGIGMLKFPNGGILDGIWQNGMLNFSEYVFADKLRHGVKHWQYCKMPDRRFFLEQTEGLRSAPSEQLSADDLPRVVPPGMFDVGDGLYSLKTKCVTDPITGEVLRIPPASEEQWIVEHARTAELETVGFCPQFYENLFGGEHSTSDERTELSTIGEELERELLKVVQQEGCELEPTPKDIILDPMHNLRLKELKREMSSSSSRSFEEILFSDLIRNMELNKSTSVSSLTGSLEKSLGEDELQIGSKELRFYKLLHDIGFKVSGRIKQLLLQDQLADPGDSTAKRIHSFSATKNSLEVLRELKKILSASVSENTMAFTISSSDFSIISTPPKTSEAIHTEASGVSELTFAQSVTEDSRNVFSDYIGSTENLNIDYLEFEPYHD